MSPRSRGNLFLKERATFKEIANYPFIMLAAMEGHSYYAKILKAFDNEKVEPDIVMESKDLTTVMALVSNGFGVSIIPRMSHAMPAEQLIIHEIEAFDARVEPVMITTQNDPISKAASQFWELVEKRQ